LPAGAGFLGSHLCDLLVADGMRVVCLDSLQTGRRENLLALEREPGFELVGGRHRGGAARAGSSPRLRPDLVFNPGLRGLAAAYQADPEHTMMTCVLGTRSLLRLAERSGRGSSGVHERGLRRPGGPPHARITGAT
jgi:UDP-glucuronate decarboxylase